MFVPPAAQSSLCLGPADKHAAHDRRSSQPRVGALLRLTRTFAALAVGTLLLAGCGGNQPPSRPAGNGALSGPACVRLLAERGIAGPALAGRDQCLPDRHAGARRPGSDRRLHAAAARPSCAMLVAWSDFEGEVDRAARATMGSPVVVGPALWQLRLPRHDRQCRPAQPACPGPRPRHRRLPARRRAGGHRARRAGAARRTSAGSCGRWPLPPAGSSASC